MVFLYYFCFMNKEFSSQVKVRFSDCDPIGHLNNVKYLEYMLNAREDHVIEHYGFSYDDLVQQIHCTWIAVENKIAYLKEVRPNKTVEISSKIIQIGERTTTAEIIMYDADRKKIHAVLWVKAIFFDLKNRKSVVHPPEILKLLADYLVEIPQQNFEQRVLFLRKENKKCIK